MENQTVSAHKNSFSAINHSEMNADGKVNFEKDTNILPEVLFITTFPPRECGIATYSQDLILAIKNKFTKSFLIKIAALELQNESHEYSEEIYAVLETDNSDSYLQLSKKINENDQLEIVLFQHEFGLFHQNEDDFITFLNNINKPKILVAILFCPDLTKDSKNMFRILMML